MAYLVSFAVRTDDAATRRRRACGSPIASMWIRLPRFEERLELSNFSLPACRPGNGRLLGTQAAAAAAAASQTARGERRSWRVRHWTPRN